MSSRIVRTVTDVKDVTKLSDNVTSDNDIISDIDGNIFLKQGTNHYIKLSTTDDEDKTDFFKNEIKTLKSSNTQLKKRVSDLEDIISSLQTPDTTE